MINLNIILDKLALTYKIISYLFIYRVHGWSHEDAEVLNLLRKLWKIQKILIKFLKTINICNINYLSLFYSIIL